MGLFQPQCPIDPAEKTWTEFTLQQISEWIGRERILNVPTLLPEDELLQLPNPLTVADAETFLDGICLHLNIPPQEMSVHFYADGETPPASNLTADDGHTTILLSETALASPDNIRIGFLRQACHHQLKSFRQEERKYDPAAITDLLMVCQGLGIGAANLTIQEFSSENGVWHAWQMTREGHLPARVLAYAMSLLCWVRNEPAPAWASALRLDARSPFQKGLKFLNKTGESLFREDTVGQPQREPSVDEWVVSLRSKALGRRVGALWQMRGTESDSTALCSALCDCLRHTNEIVRIEAILTAGRLPAFQEHTVPLLKDVLLDDHIESTATTLVALGQLQADPETVIEEAALAVTHRNRTLIDAGAFTLSCYGKQANSAQKAVCTTISKAVVACDDPLMQGLLETLAYISEDVPVVLRDELANYDPEILMRAMETWQMMVASAETVTEAETESESDTGVEN